jgi:hypothetical protein
MNFKKFCTRKNIGLSIIIFLILLFLALYWIRTLNIAHSTFENYYNFRGCVELLQRTDTYGICRTSSGEIIKIVKFKGKWFLDGDLPY